MGWTRAAVAATVVVGTAVGAIATSAAQAKGAHAWSSSPHTVVVGYRTDAELTRALRGLGVTVVRRLPALHSAELRTRGPASALAARLRRREGIQYAEPLVPRRRQAEPSPGASATTGLEWQYSAVHEDAVPDWVLRAASSVTIAVVDTGADLTAPDLAAKAPTTYDVFGLGHGVSDLNGHGTFVASLAAGSVTNGDGFAGFGGDARLLVIRAGRADGKFTDVDEAAGIVYAVDHGARIVNLSIGGVSTSTTERRAVAYAAEHGVLLVAAVGNERLDGNPVEYPAALLQPDGPGGPGAIGLAVAASTAGGLSASFSNTGSYVSLAAPGVGVLGAVASTSSPSLFPRTALPGTDVGLYGYASGTSFAAPEVAGAAALVWAANPALSAAGVADALERTASGLGSWSPDLGYGVIDVAAAVDRTTGTPAVLVSPTLSRNRLHLAWTSAGAASYRVTMSENAGPERVVLPATTRSDSWFDLAPGGAYTFTVDAYDAAGVEIAASATVPVRVARAPCSLSLSTRSSRRNRRVMRVRVAAVLHPADEGVAIRGRPLLLQVRGADGWRPATRAVTDSRGRAVWSVVLPAGSYAVRAVYRGSGDLTGASSRSVRLVLR